MSMRSNFARFLTLSNRLLRRYRGDIMRGKWRYQKRGRFHSLTLIHRGNFDLNKMRIETENPSDVEEKKEEKDGFLEDTRQAILILVRFVIVGSVIIALIIVYLITRLTHATLFPIILRKGIEFLGPIFIKGGQWISTRRDIFSRDICDTLLGLQQNAMSHSWQYTKHLLESTYGPCWRDLFVKFDERLIGSGCCAQVYKAWIDLDVANVMTARDHQSLPHFMENKTFNKNDKFEFARRLQVVAVKVLHPGIKDQLKRDIAIMRGLCKCAIFLIPELHWLSLMDCIDEFARIMENQIDMRLEAVNLAKFATNFSKRNDIVFPTPFMHLTHQNILVESFHEGSPISNYLEHDNTALQRKLAKIGIAAVLKMIFKDNFIHCDLHPGNILVKEMVVPKTGLLNTFRRVITPDYVANDLRLIILDCGLVASLDDRCRRNLRDVFYAVLMGNGEMAAQYILEQSSHITPDPDGFKHSIKNILKSHLRNPLNVNVSIVVTELFSAMVRHQVKQDASFSSVILSILVIEGLGRCLDPKINIFSEILPFIVNSTMYD